MAPASDGENHGASANRACISCSHYPIPRASTTQGFAVSSLRWKAQKHMSFYRDDAQHGLQYTTGWTREIEIGKQKRDKDANWWNQT
eukprot:1830528-Amphidinium_carterae.1